MNSMAEALAKVKQRQDKEENQRNQAEVKRTFIECYSKDDCPEDNN